MPRWDVTGVWAGEYWYDPSPQFPALPPPTPFRLVAEQGWFGRFRGTVRDAPAGGQPAEAAVAGRVTRTGLWFRKWYPVDYVWLGDRVVTLADGVAAEHGVRLDADPAPAPIWYRGECDPADGGVRGTWEVRPHWVHGSSGGQPVTFPVPGYSGGWRMERRPD